MRHRGLIGFVLFALALVVIQVAGSSPAAATTSGAEIVVVGGNAVVPDAIYDNLEACTNGAVVRVAGRDRYATAAAIAKDWASADTVFLATGRNYPDALGAGPVASLVNSPILLTDKNVLPDATSKALARLSPSRIVLLGGTAVISADLEAKLAAQYPEVIRLAGPDRYETAAAISAWHFVDGASTVYVATGVKYLDAMVAGPRAAAEDAPLLLVTRDSVPGATAKELQRLAPDRIVIVGSSGIVGDGVAKELARYTSGGVSRIAGASRYSTAAAAAAKAPGARVFIVTGDNFPDGITAAPATHGAPILFVNKTQMNSTTTAAITARTGVACKTWKWIPPYPNVGHGKRIIYSNSAQRVWLINADETLHDTYLVSGRVGIPHYATYKVFSKSVNAWAPYGGITMKYMVRFVRPHTFGNQWSYGFHAIPRYSNGKPMQTEAQLGTHRSGGCVRQADAKAKALYAWAPIGTTVHAIP